MSQLDLSGCKKRKRNERVFKFKVFGERGHPVEFNGDSTFEQNVRALLEFGQVESGGLMASWSFQLEISRNPSLQYLFLFVVEEPVEQSLELYCKHCQYIGWGQHMICNKKYHFLLPSKPVGSSGEYCKSNLLELQGDQGSTHSLHGIFHSNGFGHLLCINGSESGSVLPGYQIMEFWDRLCSGLGARKVSLKDVAKKKGMDLRLLHMVAYGKPWFGHWGYNFGRGSFGVSQDIYQSAVNAIQNTYLITLITPHDQLSLANDIQVILHRYQLLSGHSLATLADLFHFMMELKFRIPKEKGGYNNNNNIDSHYPRIMSDASCRWSPKRVEMAVRVVVEALKRAEARWVSRQHVRDVARAHIGDTGLLDFVLKSLSNHAVGKYFVRRCLNPVTKVLEYCLEDLSGVFPKQESFPLIEAKWKKVSWAQLMRDMLYMYENVLNDRNGLFGSTIPVAARIILDSKYFLKEYLETTLTNDIEAKKRMIYCAVVLANEAIGTPYHCFVLRSNATFDELRCEVERAFREMYFGLRNFVAELMRNMKPKGSDLVFKAVKSGGRIEFECNINVGMINGGIHPCEGIHMVVDCICGANEDDGERMVSCDVCQVWQHTRCVGISDEDEVPTIFLCCACERDIMSFPCLPLL